MVQCGAAVCDFLGRTLGDSPDAVNPSKLNCLRLSDSFGTNGFALVKFSFLARDYRL